MRTRTPRSYTESLIRTPEQGGLRALFHNNTKLNEQSFLHFRERVEAFASASATALKSDGPKVYPSRPHVVLPTPKRRFWGTRLDDSLVGRRSNLNNTSSVGLAVESLGALLFHSLKVLDSQNPLLRPYPSAGGLFPIEVYIAALRCPSLQRAWFHYNPVDHGLADLAICQGQPWFEKNVFLSGDWGNVSALLVFTMVFERIEQKYGDRGYRFALLEAGHAAQNILLVAHSLGVPALPLGGFCEDALAAEWGLVREVESPVYCIALGGSER